MTIEIMSKLLMNFMNGLLQHKNKENKRNKKNKNRERLLTMRCKKYREHYVSLMNLKLIQLL